MDVERTTLESTATKHQLANKICRELNETRRLLPQSKFSSFGFARNWFILMLLINIPPVRLVNAVSFYYGANENTFESFKNIANRNEQLDAEELENVYNFCNILPLLGKTGRLVDFKNAEIICRKLVVLLEPMFNDKRSFAKRRRLIRSSLRSRGVTI